MPFPVTQNAHFFLRGISFKLFSIEENYILCIILSIAASRNKDVIVEYTEIFLLSEHHKRNSIDLRCIDVEAEISEDDILKLVK